jgi:hypothetical protein
VLFKADGSICGRAGRRFRRMSLVFFAGGSVVVMSVVAVVVRAFEGSSATLGEAERFREGDAPPNEVRALTTSAMMWR